jgi:mevalonate kinase
VKASAPGKVILFGEHAVVYGRPALAVPVMQVQADADVAAAARPGIWIEAPDIGLHTELHSLPSDHPLGALIRNLCSALGIDPFPNLEIKITSTIPVASGLGSGAAVSVALTRALSAAVNRPLTEAQVNGFAYEIEKLHHGTPSGIDNTVITYARPVFFIKGSPIQIVRVGRPFTILIADTGIAAPTRESVGDVRRLWENDHARWDAVFDEMGRIAHSARENMQSGNWEALGGLMNSNHALLQELTVSSPELDRLVESARGSGAVGAKLSGGGRGGNMIALVSPGTALTVAKALREAGAKSTIITQVA